MSSLLFGQNKPKTVPKAESESRTEPEARLQLPQIKGSPLFAKQPALPLVHEDEEGGDDSGGGHQAHPADAPLAKSLPSPDRATPSLFANGKGATSAPSDPNVTRKIRTKTAGGLTPRQFFGENRQQVKNKKKATPLNLANPSTPINKILGPRVGRK